MEFRLSGINAPKTKGDSRDAGLQSKQFVTDAVMGKEVIIVTKKDTKEKYGRYLAEVFFLVGAEWVSLNKTLLDKGLAVPFMV